MAACRIVCFLDSGMTSILNLWVFASGSKFFAGSSWLGNCKHISPYHDQR